MGLIRTGRHWLFVVRSRVWAMARRLRRRLQGPLPPNVDQITAQLFVGGFIDIYDWAILYEQGVTVDVNLQAERQDQFGPFTPDGYLWLPTLDHSAPDLDALRRGVAYVHAALAEERKILIHCHAGMGRSALLCAAVLVAEGRSADEAWQIVKASRKAARLNRWQRAALETFAAQWQREQAAVPA